MLSKWTLVDGAIANDIEISIVTTGTVPMTQRVVRVAAAAFVRTRCSLE